MMRKREKEGHQLSSLVFQTREDNKVWKARGDWKDRRRREFLRKSAREGKEDNAREVPRESYGRAEPREEEQKRDKRQRDGHWQWENEYGEKGDRDSEVKAREEGERRAEEGGGRYSERSYRNTDNHPREDIRTCRSGPNSEIFDEFAREITMKASRPAIRGKPVGGRRPLPESEPSDVL